jgi:hypothetical protein
MEDFEVQVDKSVRFCFRGRLQGAYDVESTLTGEYRQGTLVQRLARVLSKVTSPRGLKL